MAQMDEQQKRQLIVDTANAIQAGVKVGDDDKRQAAGWALHFALADGNVDLIDLVILAAGGHPRDAVVALMDLALQGGIQQSADNDDAIDSLLSGGSAPAGPATKPTTTAGSTGKAGGPRTTRAKRS